MDLGIKGRVAVITGGDSGIGLATAATLLREGARVALCDKDPAQLEHAATRLMALGEVVTVTADLTQPGDVERLHQKVTGSFGPAEILVHAAGITGATGPFHTLSDEDWMAVLQVNLMAAVRMCRAFIPGMQAAKWGRVVLIGSEDAEQPYPDELPYCAAKAAILNLSKGLSKTYASSGVLVNTVSPAFIATPMTDAMMQSRAEGRGTGFDQAVASFLEEERPGMPLGRRGEAEEVAAAIAFLVSNQASFINGVNLRVDSGSVATV